jgi:serine/threonine protein kinase, bacterial
MKKALLFLLIPAAFFISSCSKEKGYNITSFNLNPANVTILAGNGGQGNNNGTGTSAQFNNPSGLAVDTGGNVFVADYRNNQIRHITAAGLVTTFAGSGLQGSHNDAGIYASFFQPAGVALDASGNLYVADSNNNLIREITPTGVVTTLAGTGTSGFVNGPANMATFSFPQGIAVDASGNVYVADNGNNLIREISAAGIVTTLAGNGTQGVNNGVDTAANFYEPTGIAVDAAGNVYVADYGNNLIRKISAGGGVTTVAGSGVAGLADGTGTAASFNGPAGIALDAAGNLYVADYGNNRLRGISPAGVVTTLGAGSGSSFKKYTFTHPYGITLDTKGNIYVAVYGDNTVQKITKQ